MTNLPVHYFIREDGTITLEGFAIDPGGFRGTSPSFMLIDEHLILRPETSLRPRNIDTVRTIVAKHLPENEPLPKRNWLQRWLTNPEPDEQPEEYLIVGEPTPLHIKDMRERFAEVETPYANSLMGRLTEAHLNAMAEDRRKAAREAVLVAALHLETHLANLANETMTDTIARAATRDCIEIVRSLHQKMEDVESGVG